MENEQLAQDLIDRINERIAPLPMADAVEVIEIISEEVSIILQALRDDIERMQNNSDNG